MNREVSELLAEVTMKGQEVLQRIQNRDIPEIIKNETGAVYSDTTCDDILSDIKRDREQMDKDFAQMNKDLEELLNWN